MEKGKDLGNWFLKNLKVSNMVLIRFDASLPVEMIILTVLLDISLAFLSVRLM